MNSNEFGIFKNIVIIFTKNISIEIHGAPFKSLQTILPYGKAYNVLVSVFSNCTIKVGSKQVMQQSVDPLRLFCDLKRGQF